ncbi:hypothetical protein RQP46_006846 [Phenoliferia psychrophenolica]
MLATRAFTPLRSASRQIVQQRRGVHIVNKVGDNFPFKYENKRAFTVWFSAVMTLGWAVPFVACGWQQ